MDALHAWMIAQRQIVHDGKDVLTRLPTQQASEINELLPHLWAPI
jgi:hypothetical protein